MSKSNSTKKQTNSDHLYKQRQEILPTLRSTYKHVRSLVVFCCTFCSTITLIEITNTNNIKPYLDSANGLFMLDPQPIQFVVLAIALSLLVAQLFVAKKQTLHVLFAIFCASIALTITKKISGESIGSYQYLIGMGACATCNVYWLISRTLFRANNPFSIQHVLLAVAIAVLIMARQGHLLVDSVWGVSAPISQFVSGVIVELTIMLSSFVLIMSGWEAVRGFNQATRQEKTLRLTFLTVFLSAVAIAKLVDIMYPNSANIQQLVLACLMIAVMLVTQFLISQREATKVQQLASANTAKPLRVEASEQLAETQVDSGAVNKDQHEEDGRLTQQIQDLLLHQKLFLQANLKVADVARELNEPEYKVSRVLRHQFDAKNFNQFVNELRIEHAKTLLTDAEKQKWPVLVVGLESGFASVGPFTRAFKSMTGSTPNQYRKAHCQLSNG